MYGSTDSYSTQSVRLMFHILHISVWNSFSAVRGELEHRTSKVRFTRTSRKEYVSQLASIERRQARIRTRRQALNLADPVPNKAEEHHVIGLSQNFLEDLTRVVQTNMGDPTFKVNSQFL